MSVFRIESPLQLVYWAGFAVCMILGTQWFGPQRISGSMLVLLPGTYCIAAAFPYKGELSESDPTSFCGPGIIQGGGGHGIREYRQIALARVWYPQFIRTGDYEECYERDCFALSRLYSSISFMGSVVFMGLIMLDAFRRWLR